MKYKKYILILLLIVVVGWNRVEAATDECYYIGDDFKATLNIKNVKPKVKVDLIGTKLDNDSETIINWTSGNIRCGFDCPNITAGGYMFNDLYVNAKDAKANGTCPNYLVIEYCNNYHIWGTNDLSVAQQAVDGINGVDNCIGRYATFKNGNDKITSDQYYSTFITPNAGGQDVHMDDPAQACKEIFGDPDYAGEDDVDLNGNGVIDPPSVAYLINTALKYVRIIVPILIIVLGSIDLGKAVVAGKEDEMKKARTTFIKRLIAGVIIFFVPAIVNVVMRLADIVWDGMGLSHCELP